MGVKIFGSITNFESIENLNDNPKIKLDASSNQGDFAYFKCRACTADEPNSNGDMFPADELKASYITFIGTNVDIEHDTSVVIGKIIDAVYVESKKENVHDHVELICKLDRNSSKNSKVNYVSLIESGVLNQVSIEAYAEVCNCGICGHEFNYTNSFPCDHIKNYLGRKIKGEDGTEKFVYKKDKKLTFSGLGVVGNPADKTADVFTVIAKEDENKNITADNNFKEDDIVTVVKETECKVQPFGKEPWAFIVKPGEAGRVSTVIGDNILVGWDRGVAMMHEQEIKKVEETKTEENKIENKSNVKYFDIKTIEDAWSMGEKEIEYNGKKYRVRKMSYGSYFLEPAWKPEKGETEGFDSDTLWLEKENINNVPKYKIESKIKNVNDNLGDALKKLNALDFLTIIKSIENKNSGKTQSIAMDIMAKAEILTEKEFYEILSKDHGKLTTIEIEDIKNILRANKKLLGNEYGAYTFTDNGESYWVIEKYGKPEFKKRISDIWGEDWKKEDIKIDGMGLKEYAISSAFKKRVLSTIASNGLDYLKEAWGVENNIKEEVTEIDVLNEIKSYAENKLGIKLSSSEIVEYMFKNGNPNIISASETHYVKDKFCDCVNKNMENINIALKGKQSRTDAVESFCYNTIVGSRIVASERKNMDMNKIVWGILGSEYCKCVEKNDEKVCSYLESEVIGYDKLSLSHKIFAKQFEINSFNMDWPYYTLNKEGQLVDEEGNIDYPNEHFEDANQAEQFLTEHDYRGNVR